MEERLIKSIEDAMKEQEISQADLARKTGLSRATISRVLSGKQSNMTRETMKSILEALNLNSSDFNRELSMLSLKEGHNLVEIYMKKIKIVGSVRAGKPMLVSENLEGELLVDNSALKKGAIYYGLKINGDSMDREFREGTVVVVEKTDTAENGDIAVVGINGDEATVKKVQFQEENIVLIPMSNNPAHVPVIKNYKKDDVHIFGVVVQSIKRYK